MKLRLPNLSRFSLRTLFVLVTMLAVGIYVGRQYQIVKERREVVRIWLRSHKDGPGYEYYQVRSNPIWIREEHEMPIPWIRRMLGDGPIWLAFLLPAADEDRTRILTALPDAKLSQSAGPHWVPIDRGLVK